MDDTAAANSVGLLRRAELPVKLRRQARRPSGRGVCADESPGVVTFPSPAAATSTATWCAWAEIRATPLPADRPRVRRPKEVPPPAGTG